MTVVVLCNVGSRDVAFDGQFLDRARERGEEIWNLLQRDPAAAERLTFPIIEPSLRELLRSHPEGLDLLALFGTDQEDPRFRHTDTLFFAQIIAQVLPGRLGGKVRRAEARTIARINPSLYDEAFEAMGRLLRELPCDPREVEVCYVVLAGGTPACNTALLLQGVRYYGDRLQTVYLPQGREPVFLRAGQQVVRAFQEEAAVERLRHLDFANALPLLERLGAPPGLIPLVRYAARRLDFDFEAAQEALREAYRDGDRALRQFIDERRLRDDLDPLLREGEGRSRLKALLRELFWNARITYLHRRYADFLGRVYRLQEAVLRLLVEEIYGLSTDLSPAVREENLRRWAEGIQSNPALREYLERQLVEGHPLDWRSVSRPTYKAMLAYAVEGGKGADGHPLLPEERRRRYEALLRRVNQLDPLVELRHRTIIGHDFHGVSEESLRARYAPKRSDGRVLSPVEGLEEIMRMLEVDIQADPYRAIAEFAEGHLRQRAA